MKIEKSQSISLLSHFTKYYSQAIDLVYNKISYMIITNNTNYNVELAELQRNLEELLKAENDTSIDILYIPTKVETTESEATFDAVTFVLGLLLGLIASLLILLYIIYIYYYFIIFIVEFYRQHISLFLAKENQQQLFQPVLKK